MELTNQVATLQDEVKLLKGEIKSILKEIRTAVLSRDNPFSVGLDVAQTPMEKAGGSAQGPASPMTEPEAVVPAAVEPVLQIPPAPQAMPALQAMPPPQPAVVIQGGSPPAPGWAGPVPAPQPAPAPFTPSAAPTPVAPPPGQAESAGPAAALAREDDEPEALEDEEMPANEPIPIRPARQQARRKTAESPEDAEPEPVRERPAWNLPTIAGLAVWAEDALATLGPRRFQFVLELATFAELLSGDAREVLASLIDADTLSHEDERPLNVNECLVVLRQLEAIVHGEKVIKLPKRRGVRHRRIR